MMNFRALGLEMETYNKQHMMLCYSITEVPNEILIEIRKCRFTRLSLLIFGVEIREGKSTELSL